MFIFGRPTTLALGALVEETALDNKRNEKRKSQEMISYQFEYEFYIGLTVVDYTNFLWFLLF